MYQNLKHNIGVGSKKISLKFYKKKITNNFNELLLLNS